MAYYCGPHSYGNAFYGSPFARRRPSPAPTTYYQRATSDPYVRAVAEEQATRAELQGAIQREREARQRRAEEEAKARIREQARREARARQRPQSFFVYPSGYGFPGYRYGNFEDEDDDEDDYAFSPFFSVPRREPAGKQQSQAAPGAARSQSRSPVHEQQQSPAEPSTSPRVSIPITTPSEAARPRPTDEEKNGAATKIQSAYRVHAALSSITTAREHLNCLLNAFSFPSGLDFDTSSSSVEEDARPKLAFSSRNAPLHAHEDALLRVLQALDAVESHGDARVRDARRELVREIETELARVDAEVRRLWEEVRPSADAGASVEAMDIEVEPRGVIEEATTVDEPKEDEVEEPLNAITTNEAKANEASEAMDVEVEPYIISEQTLQEEATTAKEPIIEDPPSIESPGAFEVETPPDVAMPLPSPTVHAPELQSVTDGPLPVAPPSEPASDLQASERAASAAAPESTSSSELDAEVEEELVLVDAVRPPSPSPSTALASDKEFVLV